MNPFILFVVGGIGWFLLGYLGLRLLARKGYEVGSGSAALRDELSTSSAYTHADPLSKGSERAFEVAHANRYATASYAVGGALLFVVALLMPRKKRHV